MGILEAVASRVGVGCVPMYHPCAMKMRSAKRRKSTPVPIHLYVMKGVDLSR